jgi:hypothetical protein
VVVEIGRQRQFGGTDGDLPADVTVVGPAVDRHRWCR